MIEKTLTTPYGEFCINKGILCFKFYPNYNLNAEIAKYIVKEQMKFSEGKIYPLFIDMRKLKSASKEAATYLSTEEAVSTTSAGALLVDSFFSKLLGNFYLNIFKPSRTFRIFSDEGEALKWLQEYIKVY